MNPSTSPRSALLLLALIAILLFFIITPIQSSPLPVDQATTTTENTPLETPSGDAPGNNTTTSVDDGASVFSGDATFYSPGLGACGSYNSANDMIVALNTPQFGPGNPNLNPNCNRLVEITYEKKTIIAKITDKCPGCNSESLDLSPATFAELAPLSCGRIHILWHFVK